MDNKKRIAHVLIHGFAVSHAVTAATLAQTIVGDEAVLTALTISMIIAIARLYGQTVEVGTAFALLGTFAGFYLGTRTAIFLVKWIPFVGNAANALATTMTTETLGWVTYYIVSSGKTIKDIKKEEVKKLIKESINSRKELKSEWTKIRQVINSMSDSDRNMYEKLEEELRKDNLNESEQKEIENKIDNLFMKYGL